MENNEYRFCLAEQEDAEKIAGLMHEVHEGMKNQDHFVCDDLDYVRRHIEEEGFILLAKDRSGMVAGLLIIHIPGNGEENLGRDIGLAEKDWEHVAHMESAVVHPCARGRHLQTRLLLEAETILEKKGYVILLATVHPENLPSRRSLEKAGFHLVVMKEKYGGLLRAIMAKAL
ncbi:MAG: GNAT family N-acetyltransferase [Blautia sp.]|nr:GNAT family N-acetyltransferase [Blautia sp.]